jgi:hypothetical protein
VQGGFFLRKKPLKLALPVYSNSETALGEGYDQESCFWAREIALTDATIRARNPAMNPYKVYDREGLFLLINSGASIPWRWASTVSSSWFCDVQKDPIAARVRVDALRYDKGLITGSCEEQSRCKAVGRTSAKDTGIKRTSLLDRNAPMNVEM